MTVKFRIPFMMLAMLNLLAGLAAGLVRMGWQFKVNNLAPVHGAIMVGGFLGTLIALEKIIPLKNRTLFVIPILSASSLIFFLAGHPQHAIFFLTLASLCLAGLFIFYFLKHKDLPYLLISAGGICWLLGNAYLYSNQFYPAAFPMWLAFVLLIIVGERIELMKLLPVTKQQKMLLLGFLAMYLVSSVFTFHGIGKMIAGISLVGISIWLLKFDVVGISISKSHLTKYVAIALLCGYASLLLCGVFFLSIHGSIMAYDVVVHTFFIGFVFSMIFAHGPIILTGVLGLPAKPFHNIFYFFLSLLHVSWLVRVYGDIFLNFEWRKISGILSTVAILGYFISLIVVSSITRRGKTI